MKVWKRCLAALLTFTILYTSTNIAQAAGIFNTKFNTWTATKAEILAEHYGLSDKEKAVLLNDAINQGYKYLISYPYENTDNTKKNLVAVDYLEKNVYVKAYYSGGYTWQPTKAVIRAEGEEQETILFAPEICYYNDVEYYAAEAFTYSGNSYTVEVIYELWDDTTVEEQNRILQIPVMFAQTVKNLETGLKGLRSNAKSLGDMAEYMPQLLATELPAEKTVITEEIDEDGNPVKKEEVIQTTEPAFDAEEHAEIITALEALYQEYTENAGLVLYHLCEEYSQTSNNVLGYTFEKGAEILAQSQKMYEYMSVIKNSTHLKTVLNAIKTSDPDLYANVQYLQSTAKNIIGSAARPGSLKILSDEANWTILDESVQASVFTGSYKEAVLSGNYQESDFSELESAVYALKGAQIEMPAITTDPMLAATRSVTCEITTYDINVTVSGEVTASEVGSKELVAMEPATAKITLLEGTSVEKIEQAIRDTGVETAALAAWNALNSEYQINAGNYDREVTEVTKALSGNLEYKISYSPKYYKVKTNFAGSGNFPYGYKIEFPYSQNEDYSYDYVVETEEGTRVSYNEGITYKVTKPVTITQTEGLEKTEYRLYDFLVEDVQYTISDEAKSILRNSAVDSPTLKIRVPDGSSVGEVVLAEGVYSVSAADVASGIYGMTWEPYIAYVMYGDTVLEQVAFADGTASWTDASFSHVRVDYRLKIEKVKNGILNRDLDEVEDVLYALNLPNDLVTDVATQNQLLGGDGSGTVKTLYEKLAGINGLMTQNNLSLLKGAMKTDEAKDAVRRLQSSENQIVVSTSGKKMGYGAWNTSADKLAIYTYMELCADANWSLATYYQKGYYEPLAKQAGIVAECLEAISADPGFNRLFEDGSDEKRMINEVIPQLKQLSESLSAPHRALNVNNENFSSLIEQLISLEGQFSSVDSSNGIYAYSSIRRNGENCGSLTISVKVGSKVAKTKEISYLTEDGSHVLTEEEYAAILGHIADLEASCGMTEDEKQYYDLLCTGMPQAGASVGKNETLSFIYSPKEYVVTFAGINNYEASFKYQSDYVIELPTYSEDVNERSYYCFLIKGEEKRVYNGTSGYYTFTKEDLTELFVNQHYEIEVIIRQNISDWDVVPEVTESEDVICESYLDFDNKLLLLDAAPTGLSRTQFQKYVNFVTGAGEEVSYIIYNSNRDSLRDNWLATGTIVECNSLDQNGENCVTTYTIVLMGDVNKDGLTDADDVQTLTKNYLGTAEKDEKIGDTSSKLAADMNGNGNYRDSNDALQIVMKYKYWGKTSGKTYASVLK